MSFRRRLMELYFDLVYNPVYDFTTARTSPYRRLLETCVEKLQFQEGDRVLCVGVGTGNEILHMLEKNDRISITGVDTSKNALRRARRKAGRRGKEISLFRMDAHNLGFASQSFDKVFCHHVMGFLSDDRRATGEMLRVLGSGGQFVITYPSGSGSKALGEIWRSIVRNFGSGRVTRAAVELIAVIGAAVANIPVAYWARPRQGFYSPQDLEYLFASVKAADYGIQEDSIYEDLILYGRKL